jgi:hypothetical protein
MSPFSQRTKSRFVIERRYTSSDVTALAATLIQCKLVYHGCLVAVLATYSPSKHLHVQLLESKGKLSIYATLFIACLYEYTLHTGSVSTHL